MARDLNTYKKKNFNDKNDKRKFKAYFINFV